MTNTPGNGSSFNQEFCTHLEYHLCRTFQRSERKDLKWLGCDGISSEPAIDSHLLKEHVKNKKLIVTKAWIGEDGQDEYHMAIHFGKRSLKRYANDASLIDCIPSEDTLDWIDIDTERKTIEIWLD